MVNGYIYGEAMPFNAIMARIIELQERFNALMLAE